LGKGSKKTRHYHSVVGIIGQKLGSVRELSVKSKFYWSSEKCDKKQSEGKLANARFRE